MNLPLTRSRPMRRRYQRVLSLAFGFSIAATHATETTPSVQLTDLIFDYRAQNGLPAIAMSPSLDKVASLHVADLERHAPGGRCNNHSWSANPRWSACCYTRDHAQARCMWDKPREITRGAYTGHGFEIVCWSSDRMTPERAMACWQRSAVHHNVILNRGVWRDTAWRAMGVRMSEHYAVLWLGMESDR